MPVISEGRGSLLFFLKARGWVTSIFAGVGDEGLYRSKIAYIFGMSIHLTDSGLEKVLLPAKIKMKKENIVGEETSFCLKFLLFCMHFYYSLFYPKKPINLPSGIKSSDK